MANRSEKSEGPVDASADCPIAEPLSIELDKLYARTASDMLAAGIETSLDDALAHTLAHVLRWTLETAFTMTGGDMRRTAEAAMMMVGKIGREHGHDVETHVVSQAKSKSTGKAH